MKKFKFFGSIIILIIFIAGCSKSWEDHYINTQPPSVDMNIWDSIKKIPEFTKYVEVMEQFELDSLFEANQTYTLFIPTNDAFDNYTEPITLSTLYYHISRHFIQSGNISGTERIQILSEKFVPFTIENNARLFDGIEIDDESALFLNGKFYKLKGVASPKPNLFEYFVANNSILSDFIEALDSIEIDKTLSRPIGFNDNGDTEYDTVLIITNEFEDDYFKVRQEYRNKTATFVFPNTEDYNNALDNMAADLGPAYSDHTKIPLAWQNKLLIPHLLENGVFENSLDEVEFIKTGGPNDTLKLKNILGDSIAIEYQVAEKAICSNGIVYQYKDFEVPDTLVNGRIRIEMESFLKETGINKFSWDDELVKVTTDFPYAPTKSYVKGAGNDSIAKVTLNNNYNGRYILDLKIESLFIRKYLMVVRTNIGFGGIYKISLNGAEIKTVDYFDYVKNPWYYPGVDGALYTPENNKKYSYWDAWADNTEPYGKATLRIEYVEPGASSNLGLIIDYIEFIPYN